jgi:hypothetical protein
MKTFELHTFKDNRWVTDSIFDDRDLALHEARKVEESGRYSSVQLIEENYDETTNLTTAQTIFRGGKSKQAEKKGRPAAARPVAQRSRSGASGEPARKGRVPRREPKKTSLLVPILVLLIVALAGGAGLLAMQVLGAAK